MEKTVILNLPFNQNPYNANEISNFENWIDYFSNKVSHVFITPPVERKRLSFSTSISALRNIIILPVSSFDTCDRWKAGLIKAIDKYDYDFFYFWSADFTFNPISEKSAENLLKCDSENDLIVGTIQATGSKELIDAVGTLPLMELWFPDETKKLYKSGFDKPRSELFRISKEFAKYLLSKRWYPSEQSINMLLQCLWNHKKFSMKSLSLGKMVDDEKDRQSPNSIQQLERMELWIRYMWREHNANWSSNEYLSKTCKSHKTLREANKSLLQIGNSNECIPSEESYRFIIELSWQDIHHSRNQDWTALGVVFGAHLGIFQLLNYIKDHILPNNFSIYYVIGSLVGIAISIIGAMIAYRHKHLSSIKMEWITEAEDRIGLLKPYGVIDPKPYKGIQTSKLIFFLYFIFIAIDLMLITIFANKSFF